MKFLIKDKKKLEKIKSKNKKISWYKVKNKFNNKYDINILKKEWEKIKILKDINININNSSIEPDEILLEALELFKPFKKEKKYTLYHIPENITTNNLFDEDIEIINFNNILNNKEKITFDNWYIQMNNGGIIKNYSYNI